MNAAGVLDECRANGVEVFLADNGIRVRGHREALGRLLPILKNHKKEILDRLHAEKVRSDLTSYFLEIDGMTPDEARRLAALSLVPRRPEEWVAMISELDKLIGEFCDKHSLSEENRAHVMGERLLMPQASIPGTLAWFRSQLGCG